MVRPPSYELRFEVGAPRSDVFALLSDPENLNRLTPRWFDLTISSPRPVEVRLGAEIAYRLRWRGLPLAWSSRIVVWEPPELFSYEQARGPFRGFRHEHAFEESGTGTRVLDRVTWRSWGGRLVDPLIRRDLATIFHHRAAAVRTVLGDAGPH